MLACFSELGYVVEWRVINAAEYGMPQRRRRVFIIAHKRGTDQHRILSRKKVNAIEWLTEIGTIARAFPVHSNDKAELVNMVFLLNKKTLPI